MADIRDFSADSSKEPNMETPSDRAASLDRSFGKMIHRNLNKTTRRIAITALVYLGLFFMKVPASTGIIAAVALVMCLHAIIQRNSYRMYDSMLQLSETYHANRGVRAVRFAVLGETVFNGAVFLYALYSM
jgi:hypothetical protein